ncbi:MAG: efflux RND transporter periplasmic adaptor subunit [Planctomycetaceae bacterium]|nr:efflux RND transporter periplasmic adaptor subunit [Planctomycetaceae bacterium]
MLVLLGLAVTARAGDVHELEWSNRSVLAVRRQAVLSAEVGYRITRISREMGQTFQTGDVLIEFADAIARAGVESAKAALSAAELALNAAQSMYAGSNASQLEVENARRDVVAARSRLVVAEYELASCVVAAPFSGRVAEVYVNEHELVAKGTRLLAIVDDSTLFVKFLLPESSFGSVALGDRFQVDVQSNGVVKEAVVTHIAAILDPASRTFEVWAGVDNTDGRLRAGMVAALSPMDSDSE